MNINCGKYSKHDSALHFKENIATKKMEKNLPEQIDQDLTSNYSTRSLKPFHLEKLTTDVPN